MKNKLFILVLVIISFNAYSQTTCFFPIQVNSKGVFDPDVDNGETSCFK